MNNLQDSVNLLFILLVIYFSRFSFCFFCFFNIFWRKKIETDIIRYLFINLTLIKNFQIYLSWNHSLMKIKKKFFPFQFTQFKYRDVRRIKQLFLDKCTKVYKQNFIKRIYFSAALIDSLRELILLKPS